MKHTKSKTEFCIYLSYPMHRDDEETFYNELQTCIDIGTEIKAWLIDWEKMYGLPKSYLYVPAEQELFIHRAYTANFLTEKQIAYINSKIIESSDLLILFSNYNPEKASSNILAEAKAAKEYKVPIYTMPDLSDIAISALKFAIKTIIKAGD